MVSPVSVWQVSTPLPPSSESPLAPSCPFSTSEAFPPLSMSVPGPPLTPSFPFAAVQLTVPVPPTAGVEHDPPAAKASDTNVVLVGTKSLSVRLVAPDDPMFETLIE